MTILGMVFAKRSDLIAKLTWIIAACSVVSSAVFVMWFGLVGAAISNLLISILLTSGYFFLTQKVHAISVCRSDLRKLMIGVVVASIFVILLANAEPTVSWLMVKVSVLVGGVFAVWRVGYFSNLIPEEEADAQPTH